ncbi:MAG TPA: hypothetical protein VK586_01155 [Streptosporangiaceae bacterium]|nr:hypothetical protein [Streptosporangiaceae bacterium]
MGIDEAREATQKQILATLKEMRNLLAEIRDLLDDGLPEGPGPEANTKTRPADRSQRGRVVIIDKQDVRNPD